MVEYVPIYTTVSLGVQSWTIIGVGYLSAGQWTYAAANQQTAAQLTISPPGNSPSPGVGSQNVSGVLALALPASFSQQDVNDLFQLHGGSVTDPRLSGYQPLVNPLYAPVLVNHYIGPNLIQSPIPLISRAKHNQHSDGEFRSAVPRRVGDARLPRWTNCTL